MSCRVVTATAVSAALLVGSADASINVAFRLNTSTVYNYDITEDSMVQVRGSIPPLTWAYDSLDLINSEGDYWQGTAAFSDLEIGSTLEYKYYAGDDYSGWENGAMHTLVIPPQDTTLVLAYFNQGNEPPYAPTADIDLWFRVNVESNPWFDPDIHQAGLRGGVAYTGEPIGNLSWGSNLPLAREDQSFYFSGQVIIPQGDAGTAIQYKFVRGTAPDEWESIPYRVLTIPPADSTIVWVWWNNEPPGPAQIDTGVVLFQADMATLLYNGWFDPGTETISVRGGFEGWGNTEPMVPDPFNPTLYQWSREIIWIHGGVCEWKFKAFPDDNWLDSGWELGSNHELEFRGDTVLAPVIPAIYPSGVPLPINTIVRFTVDMTTAVCWYTGEPFPTISSVWLVGDDGTAGPLQWPNLWVPGDTTDMVKLRDNGTHGDQVSGDGFWTIDLLMPQGTLSTILYKYCVYYPGVEDLNGGTCPMDNEAGFAMNHVAVLLDLWDGFEALPIDRFGSQYAGWPPLAPIELSIEVVNPRTAALSWAPVEDAMAYHLFRATSPRVGTDGLPWRVVMAPATATVFSEGIGNALANYCFRGTVRRAGQVSPISNTVGEFDFQTQIP